MTTTALTTAEAASMECFRMSQEHEPRTTLSDGTQIYPEHRNIIPEGPRKGQQEGYVVLAEEERAKGFVRPVRQSYTHLKCGVTAMVVRVGRAPLAPTRARAMAAASPPPCLGPSNDTGAFAPRQTILPPPSAH